MQHVAAFGAAFRRWTHISNELYGSMCLNLLPLPCSPEQAMVTRGLPSSSQLGASTLLAEGGPHVGCMHGST